MYLYTFLKFLHFLGLSLGYGGVLLVALLSVKSVKNAEYFKAVAKIMPAISAVIWGGLILLAVSGVFMEDFWRVKTGVALGQVFPMLAIKKILVAAIALHGIYVNLYLGRKMAKLGQLPSPFEDPGFKRFKILGIISTSISLALWTAVVVIGIWIMAKMILG